MRRADAVLLAASGGLLLAVALPVLAQNGPESLLPPGFGQPDSAPAPSAPQPSATSSATSSVPAAGSRPTGGEDGLPPLAAILPDEALGNAAVPVEAKDPAIYDLPPGARRSLAQIGPLTDGTGGVGPDAYGQVRGHFLAGLMRATRAPIVSRWGSIVLRRVLLSGTATPGDIDGADLAAERAALLLRMGEADGARLLVQSVDPGNYTPRLYDVAMQSYLASADPAGFCPLAVAASDRSGDVRWLAARAICASFSGEQGTATSFLNQAQHGGKLRGIDYRLAEKAVGAGPNSRRSVKIEWDGVDRLDPWRFGLATATNVEIPAGLYADAGDAYRAWEARAPALSLERRLAGFPAASRLGVFSGEAAASFYAQLGDDSGDDRGSRPASSDLYDAFVQAYGGDTVGDRVKGMRRFWSVSLADGGKLAQGVVDYAALPPLSRAAAALPPSADIGADTPWLIAAMLAGGRDRNAARWVRAVDAIDGEGRTRAWALLAVGLPEEGVALDRSRIDAFVGEDASADKIASRMLVAALTGLGRIPASESNDLAGDLGMSLSVRSRWARTLARATTLRQKGTVALLAAVGMQTRDWARLPPAHLAAILTAMRQVGLEPEARMIAAEAVTRL